MAIGTLDAFVVDVNDLAVAERFWAEVSGLPLKYSGWTGSISRRDPPASIMLQLVPERKTALKNRAHLDFLVEDVAAAVAQVIGLGGSVVREPGFFFEPGSSAPGAGVGGAGRPLRQRVLPHPRAARARHANLSLVPQQHLVRNVAGTRAGHSGPSGCGGGGVPLVARTMAATRPARTRWRPVVLAVGLWVLVLLGLVATAWLNDLLRRAGRLDLAQRGAPPVGTALAALSAATVGAVVASRRPSHPVGWLLLGLGLSVPWSDVLDGYVDYGVLARPGSLPTARYLAVYSPAFMAGLACVGFVLLLTPSGSLPSPSRRWRWWARALGAAPVLFLLTVMLLRQPLDPSYESIDNPFGLPGGLPVEVPLIGVNLLAGAVVLLTVPIACVSLVVRFRRARGLERQQLRWLAFAAGLASVGAALVLAGTSLPTSPSLTFALITWGAGVCLVRCHWRSAPRSCATACMTWTASSAARSPTGCSRCCWAAATPRSCSGSASSWAQDSSLVVAAATLAVAAVFQPARRRIQAAVDRRFNRRRYDTARTIAAFSTRLREQVDLDTLTGELLAVVDQTMTGPSSLWRRPPPAHARPLSAVDR